jgi:hypothetical protein
VTEWLYVDHIGIKNVQNTHIEVSFEMTELEYVFIMLIISVFFVRNFDV